MMGESIAHRIGRPLVSIRAERRGQPIARGCLDNNGASYPRTNHNALRHIINVNSHWVALCQSYPLKGRVGIGKQFGAGRVVAVAYAEANALDMTAGDCGHFSPSSGIGKFDPFRILADIHLKNLYTVKRCGAS
jgi:hypothetical protein